MHCTRIFTAGWSTHQVHNRHWISSWQRPFELFVWGVHFKKLGLSSGNLLKIFLNWYRRDTLYVWFINMLISSSIRNPSIKITETFSCKEMPPDPINLRPQKVAWSWSSSLLANSACGRLKEKARGGGQERSFDDSSVGAFLGANRAKGGWAR